MAKRLPKKDRWMNDGDDAHFPDNPAVPKSGRRKVGAKSAPKMKAKRTEKKRSSKKIALGK